MLVHASFRFFLFSANRTHFLIVGRVVLCEDLRRKWGLVENYRQGRKEGVIQHVRAILMETSRIFHAVEVVRLLNVIFSIRIYLGLVFDPRVRFAMFGVGPRGQYRPPAYLITVRDRVRRIYSAGVLFRLHVRVPIVIS